MYWTRLASVRFVCLFVWLSSSYLSGQQSACGEQAFALSVWNHSGRTVPDLGINNFRARLHGKDLKIVAVDRQSSAHRVVIVLDASGSMNPEVQQRILQKFSSEVIRSSPASTEFALVVFTDRVLETVKFGHPREEVLWAVDHLILPARGRTALRDALLYATTLFGTAHPGDSILVITDGEDNASKASPNSLEVAFRCLVFASFSFAFMTHISRQTPISQMLPSWGVSSRLRSPQEAKL